MHVYNDYNTQGRKIEEFTNYRSIAFVSLMRKITLSREALVEHKRVPTLAFIAKEVSSKGRRLHHGDFKNGILFGGEYYSGFRASLAHKVVSAEVRKVSN